MSVYLGSAESAILDMRYELCALGHAVRLIVPTLSRCDFAQVTEHKFQNKIGSSMLPLGVDIITNKLLDKNKF